MTVKLKSYFGIHPAICYLLKLFLILIALGIFPSFFTNSRRVYFSTDIYPISIKIDSAPSSITPYNTRLRAGRHTAEFFFKGKSLGKKDFRVKNALFYSWFFEYSQKVFYKINKDDELEFLIEKNFLENAVLYSSLYHTDSTHIQMPYFSHYRTLAKNGIDIKDDILLLGKKMIANPVAAQDFRDNFDSSFEFSQYPEIVNEKNLLPAPSFKNLGVLKIGGIDFVKVSPSLAVSRTLVGDDVNIKGAFGHAKEFSDNNSVNARLLTLDEYKNIIISNIDGSFVDIKSALWEYTSTPFTPSGEYLTSKDIEILNKYGVEPNYRLFCFSRANAALSDMEKLRLVGCVSYTDVYKMTGFRLAIEL